MADLQSIVSHLEGNGKIDHHTLSFKQNRALEDIMYCKSERMGFNEETCESCGKKIIHYNSCKNPCCPGCQAVKREKWIDSQKKCFLNIPYFHVVFTLPEEVNWLCLLDPSFMYSILFKAASQTLLTFGEDPKYLGGKIGFTCVLHTWGQNLSLHPHLHCIVSSGALTKDGKWKKCKDGFLFPVKALSKVFRGKFLDLLKGFDRSLLENEQDLYDSIDVCYESDFVVYSKKPFADSHHVIEYLGRYTHRIAISNSRILKHEHGKVFFSYKDYKDGNKVKTMALDEEEFLRRFLLHIPPKGFMRIRHYGFLGNHDREKRLQQLRRLTHTDEVFKERSTIEIISALLKRDISLCPHCGKKLHPLLE